MLSVIYAECRYAEHLYSECRYAECRYAECRGTEIPPTTHKVSRAYKLVAIYND
jgi:hypothetical protein